MIRIIIYICTTDRENASESDLRSCFITARITFTSINNTFSLHLLQELIEGAYIIFEHCEHEEVQSNEKGKGHYY